jgi:hypothetical protein
MGFDARGARIDATTRKALRFTAIGAVSLARITSGG